nr:monothiol glutaredoxin-4 [Quercus suber]
MATSTVHPVTTESEFEDVISSLPATSLAVIYFHAPWAEPCKQMSTILSTLASTYEDTQPPRVAFLSLDAEEVSEISEKYDVTQVPLVILQKGGQVVESVTGTDASKVRSAVEKHAGKSDAGDPSKAGLPPLQKVTRPPPSQELKQPSSNGAANGSSNGDLSKYVPSGNEETNPASREEVNARLSELVKAAPVMLFMKGTPSAPQCGFSRQTVSLLRERGIRYGFFNILADDEVRQGLKEFSEWPTFPQVYVEGELVGGLDIGCLPASCHLVGRSYGLDEKLLPLLRPSREDLKQDANQRSSSFRVAQPPNMMFTPYFHLTVERRPALTTYRPLVTVSRRSSPRACCVTSIPVENEELSLCLPPCLTQHRRGGRHGTGHTLRTLSNLSRPLSFDRVPSSHRPAVTTMLHSLCGRPLPALRTPLLDRQPRPAAWTSHFPDEDVGRPAFDSRWRPWVFSPVQLVLTKDELRAKTSSWQMTLSRPSRWFMDISCSRNMVGPLPKDPPVRRAAVGDHELPRCGGVRP